MKGRRHLTGRLRVSSGIALSGCLTRSAAFWTARTLPDAPVHPQVFDASSHLREGRVTNVRSNLTPLGDEIVTQFDGGDASVLLTGFTGASSEVEVSA